MKALRHFGVFGLVITIVFQVGINFVSCSKPITSAPPDSLNQTPLIYDGTMSFVLNGIPLNISIFAQRNGYVENEVVIRGSGVGMENTLMLTFKTDPDSLGLINNEMTGYWDLGLCIPFDKYLLTPDTTNNLTITSLDSVLVGEFNLTFRHESDTTKKAIFLNGAFSAEVDTLHLFEYCVEG